MENCPLSRRFLYKVFGPVRYPNSSVGGWAATVQQWCPRPSWFVAVGLVLVCRSGLSLRSSPPLRESYFAFWPVRIVAVYLRHADNRIFRIHSTVAPGLHFSSWPSLHWQKKKVQIINWLKQFDYHWTVKVKELKSGVFNENKYSAKW